MNIDVGPELRNVLGPRTSAVLSSRLRREQECSVCGDRLGETMAAVSAQYIPGPSYQQRWILSAHHRRCGRSELDRSGIVRVAGQSQYTGVSFLVPALGSDSDATAERRGLFRRRRSTRDGHPTLAPVCLVNPSLGEMVIEPRGNDTFVDISIDYFRELGWGPMQNAAFGPVDTEPLATCFICDLDTVRIQPGSGARWDLPTGPDITIAIAAAKGLLVIVTHDVHVDDLVNDPRPSRLYADGNIAYCTWAELT